MHATKSDLSTHSIHPHNNDIILFDNKTPNQSHHDNFTR